MVVKSHTEHKRMTGLHVGDGNVQQLFPPNVPRVELELDHLRIVCTLSPEFWEGEPEIHDDRLVSWLESKRMNGKLGASPSPLIMIPSGEHAFRLQPIRHEEIGTSKYPIGFSA